MERVVWLNKVLLVVLVIVPVMVVDDKEVTVTSLNELVVRVEVAVVVLINVTLVAMLVPVVNVVAAYPEHSA